MIGRRGPDKTAAYCGVRSNGSMEFFDTSTLARTIDGVQKRTREANRETPQWCKKNPVIRTALVSIREIITKQTAV